MQQLSVLAPRRLIYRTRAVALEVPYADTFVVESRWVFEQGVSGVSNMQVTVDVVFLKSCWVKGTPEIRSTAAAETLVFGQLPSRRFFFDEQPRRLSARCIAALSSLRSMISCLM